MFVTHGLQIVDGAKPNLQTGCINRLWGRFILLCKWVQFCICSHKVTECTKTTESGPQPPLSYPLHLPPLALCCVVSLASSYIEKGTYLPGVPPGSTPLPDPSSAERGVILLRTALTTHLVSGMPVLLRRKRGEWPLRGLDIIWRFNDGIRSYVLNVLISTRKLRCSDGLMWKGPLLGVDSRM